MRKILLVWALLFPLFVAAQKSPVDKLMKKYGEMEEFTKISIRGNIFKLACKFGAQDDETKKLLSQLTGISILIKSGDSGKTNFFKELNQDDFFKKNAYETLLEVTEKDQIIRFLGKEESDGKLSELLLIIGGRENVLINIKGKIDLENIEKLSSAINIQF